jgi:hypothetical protein
VIAAVVIARAMLLVVSALVLLAYVAGSLYDIRERAR